MHCPVCLNFTMELSKNGLIHLTINNRRITRGKFIFNRGKDYQSFVKGLFLALEDFYKLYSDFKNPMVIKNIELYSSDLTCKNGCSYDGNITTSYHAFSFGSKFQWMISDHRALDLILGYGIASEHDIINNATGISSNIESLAGLVIGWRAKFNIHNDLYLVIALGGFRGIGEPTITVDGDILDIKELTASNMEIGILGSF